MNRVLEAHQSFFFSLIVFSVVVVVVDFDVGYFFVFFFGMNFGVYNFCL